MPDSPEVPDAAAVLRHGNLALALWAPPAVGNDARLAFHEFLSRLIGSANAALLIGLSPSWTDRASPSADNAALDELTSSRTPSDLGRDFAEIPRELLQAHIELASRGSFNARRADAPTGELARDRVLHIATPMLLSSVTAVADAFSRLVLPPDVRWQAYVVTNPFAGLAQNHANSLRQAIRSHGTSAFLLWNGNSRAVQVHAGADALERLRRDVLAALAGT